jgi:NitT/TauT family transport system substrate-binding protein
MSLTTRRRAAVATVAALPLLALGCPGGSEPVASSGNSGDGSNASGTTTVILGLIPIIDVAPVYLGIERGFFADEGIELELSAGRAARRSCPAWSAAAWTSGPATTCRR